MSVKRTWGCEAVNASFSRPEDVLHTLLLEEVCPGTAQPCWQQISFVEQQH